jgi:guanylate kinase
VEENLHKANLFVVAAPSGAGKTTLVHALAKQLLDIHISISYTTRPPRPRDRDGVDYFFVNAQEFQAMVDKEAFLEHATIYQHQYGTAKEWVYRHLEAGQDVLLEIDWQGARQIRDLFAPAVLIFILPPSAKALHDRLVKRQQDDPDIIAYRFARAREELSHYTEFDYLVVNDHFDHALKELMAIVTAERLKDDVQKLKLLPLLADLLKKG